MPFPRWIFPCLLLLPVIALAAPSPPPAAPVNALNNGGFERFTRTADNLWDGVDGDGNLAVPTFSARVLTENRALGNMSMPPSVAVADLNGDGKPDLLVAAPTGYYFYYQNRGTPAEPRFTTAEVVPLFVSTSPYVKDYVRWFFHERDSDRYCPRISLADWRKRGVLDLLIGNFYGELILIPNSGGARQPVFAQPSSIDRALVQTDEANRLWGNLFAPVAADWNNDGKLDVLTGEGTYSANAIHLLENIGSGETPKFSSAKRSAIAYGDGREHLIPTLADFNGDGNPDLLVADRSGEIGVYLNPGPPKPGVELKRVSTVSFGGASKLPGLVAPTAADMNGDGLFDLVLGMPNGRLAIALNTGTATQPTFGAWRELKGEDRLKRAVRVPTDWNIGTDAEAGNGLAYWQVVNAQEDPASAPPEGANCIKAAYWQPVAGGTFTYPDSGIPQALNHFMITHPIHLLVNKNYKVSFKIKGAGLEKSKWNFRHYESGYTGNVKMERGERGEALREGGRITEEILVTGEFSASSNWSTVEKTLNVRYKNPALQEKADIDGVFSIDFFARGLSCTVYIDDIQVTPEG